MRASVTAGEAGADVLVIEEHEETRRCIVNALRARDYVPIEAEDATVGLRLLEARPSISAIVLDLVLPGVSGWEFRRWLLQTPRFAGIPTIVISRHALHPYDLHALRPAQVIEKPLDTEQLLTAIGRICTARAPSPDLFWSRRGEVACAKHIPAVGSAQWTDDRWCRMPPSVGKRQVAYQCQHCAADRSPIVRRFRLAKTTTASRACH